MVKRLIFYFFLAVGIPGLAAYDYGTERWGTIVSNLGFSNHFIHHHLREDGNFTGYAKKYMEILASLKVGGRFHYAPALPFIETYLNRA